MRYNSCTAHTTSTSRRTGLYITEPKEQSVLLLNPNVSVWRSLPRFFIPLLPPAGPSSYHLSTSFSPPSRLLLHTVVLVTDIQPIYIFILHPVSFQHFPHHAMTVEF